MPRMAKKQADRGNASRGKPPGKKAGRPPSSGVAREHVLGIRGTPAWKRWVVEFAAHCRMDLADLVDHSLAEFAKLKGFADVPPKR
jgi:hypothetical protein